MPQVGGPEAAETQQEGQWLGRERLSSKHGHGQVPGVTSAGTEAEVSECQQWGFGGLVPRLEEQQSCQAVPQLRRQQPVVGLPAKRLVCNKDRVSLAPCAIPATGLCQRKAPFAGLAEPLWLPGNPVSRLSVRDLLVAWPLSQRELIL